MLSSNFVNPRLLVSFQSIQTTTLTVHGKIAVSEMTLSKADVSKTRRRRRRRRRKKKKKRKRKKEREKKKQIIEVGTKRRGHYSLRKKNIGGI